MFPCHALIVIAWYDNWVRLTETSKHRCEDAKVVKMLWAWRFHQVT
jgi:hypothetical protein